MTIKELQKSSEEYLDKEIKISGWIRNHRPQKEFGFIDFNDGTSISTLKDGTFTVNGVEVNFARFGDYMLKYNAINKHLQLSYKPKVELEGGE